MRILLVEDTRDVAEAVVENFSRRGDAVDHVERVASARASLENFDYDLVILDINLPDGSGFDLIDAVRQLRPSCPILMLTARHDVEDRIDALDRGADDYLMKPFDLRELEARTRALIRRRQDERPTVIEFGDLSFDPAGPEVRLKGEVVVLSRRELALLQALLANRGRVMPKERLFEKLYTFDEAEVGMNAIELYVARVRKKLEGGNVVIRTLRNLGYQMTLDE
ncbi:Transcriptional regulatory protein tctD [Hartmannibacter diazotrophicus]|uniref:Transcriptional regulatory protein tctD n=1 Tax=Hartmannibacter diazotrophicus TaxID=1482074 RepID=A0A2C9D4M5_9HYPH|nr:response regulator transcription factor [Hartmannibacter diazotrophicus]SON55108.1 Transcriptional regulatory protein tctD [Hartmannibacter diazotrophicus]